MRRLTLSVSFAPLLFVALMAIGLGPSEARHFALDSSVPEADTVVESPAELRLAFTQEPEEGTMSIRLIDAAGELVTTGEATQSADDPMVFTSQVEGPLEAGVYTVAWRAIAQDGHTISEEFGFTVGTVE